MKHDDLPNNLDTLKKIIIEQQRLIASKEQLIEEKEQVIASKEQLIGEKEQVIASKEQLIEEKEHFIRLLRKMLFGTKSEKMPRDPNQLTFPMLFDAVNHAAEAVIQRLDEAIDDVSAQEQTKEPSVNGHGRKPFAKQLPRVRVAHQITDDERMCCGQPMKKIREEVTERLEYVPSHFKVIQNVRDVYGCPICKAKILTAPGPNHLIEKGNCTEGVLSHVVISKYLDHLPLYRLEKIFARHDVTISSSTMVDWIDKVAYHIRPVVHHMEQELKKAPCINTDETGIAVLFNKGGDKREKAHNGYMWVYRAGEDMAVFKYCQNRSGKYPEDFLQGYEGKLQCDAYGGYSRLFRSQKVIEVNCWQHAKRKFIDARESDPERADTAINLINMLYRVEHLADERGLDDGERLELRKRISADIVRELKSWLRTNNDKVLPKSPLKKAIKYTLKQWQGLSRFLDDGTLKLDNNASERAMRHVVMGRKNWIFAGSEEGARRMADIYSLIYSCQINKINPFVYLKDILIKIANGHPQKDIYALTPKGWKEMRKGSA